MAKFQNKVKGILTFIQCLILLSGILITVFILSFQYTKQIADNWTSNFDKMSYLISQYVKVYKSPPSMEAFPGYLVFVINQKDGEYVYARENLSEHDQRLWQQHYMKLIYEMQKQKQGWIFYPEKENQRFFKGHRRVIRYFYVKKFDWIVGVETAVNSEAEIFRNLIKWPMQTTFASVLAIVFLLTMLVAYVHSRLVRADLSKMLESNFLTIGNSTDNNNQKWNKESEDSLEGANNIKNTFYEESPHKEELEEISMKINEDSSKSSFAFDQNLESQENKYEEQIDKIAQQKQIVPDLEETENIENTEDYFKDEEDEFEHKPVHQNTTLNKANRNVSELDHLTLNTNNIKSPLLKKMIKEMRSR